MEKGKIFRLQQITNCVSIFDVDFQDEFGNHARFEYYIEDNLNNCLYAFNNEGDRNDYFRKTYNNGNTKRLF